MLEIAEQIASLVEEDCMLPADMADKLNRIGSISTKYGTPHQRMVRACVIHACSEKDFHPDKGLQAVRDLARWVRSSIDKGGSDQGNAGSWQSS